MFRHFCWWWVSFLFKKKLKRKTGSKPTKIDRSLTKTIDQKHGDLCFRKIFFFWVLINLWNFRTEYRTPDREKFTDTQQNIILLRLREMQRDNAFFVSLVLSFAIWFKIHVDNGETFVLTSTYSRWKRMCITKYGLHALLVWVWQAMMASRTHHVVFMTGLMVPTHILQDWTENRRDRESQRRIDWFEECDDSPPQLSLHHLENLGIVRNGETRKMQLQGYANKRPNIFSALKDYRFARSSVGYIQWWRVTRRKILGLDSCKNIENQ